MGKSIEKIEAAEKSSGPKNLFCAACGKDVGSSSAGMMQTVLALDKQLAEIGGGRCVDPYKPHQGPFVTKEQLPPAVVK